MRMVLCSTDESLSESEGERSETTTDDTDDTGYASSDSAELQPYGVEGIEVIDLTHDWSGELSSSESFGATSRGRWRNVARAVHAAEEVVSSQPSKSGFAGNRFQAAAGFLIFASVNMRIINDLLAVSLNFGWKPGGDYCVHRSGFNMMNKKYKMWFLAFFLTDICFLLFQIACARRDRTLSHLSHCLREEGKFLKLTLLYVYQYLILGICSGWQILRSLRKLRNPGYRDSFIVELSDPDMAEGASTNMPFYSSHMTFALEVAYTLRTFHSFSKNYVELCSLPVMTTAVLSYALVVYALVTFDYNVSGFVRRQYSQQHAERCLPCFGLAHYAYRGAECMARCLTVSASLLGFLKYSLLQSVVCTVVLTVDFFLCFLALCVLSKAISLRSLFLCIPLFMANLALFVDDAQLAESARSLTLLLDVVRCSEAAVAAIGYAIYWQQVREGPIVGNAGFAQRIVTCFLLILCALALQFVLRCSAFAGRKLQTEEPGSKTRTQCDPGTGVFGTSVEKSVHMQREEDISSFLFSKGFGDQFVSLMEIFREREGLRLSRLQALRKLGEGGFGQVYEVRDTRSRQHYALKLQRRNLAVAAAVREAKALHEIQHAFIVHLVHVFCTAEFFGILLELCDEDLNRRILAHLSDSGMALGLPEQQVKRYTACILLALEHLHGRNIIFRDLKPENVLTVRSDCMDLRDAKLADFGLATSVIHASRSDSRMTTTSGFNCDVRFLKVAGTPAFMPPDAFEEDGLLVSDAAEAEVMKLLFARDWYALGCCLMLMLLGERSARKARNSAKSNHIVLLPPVSDDGTLQEVLQQAKLDPANNAEALDLALRLTSLLPSVRAGAAELRQSPFLKQTVLDLQPVVRSTSMLVV